MTPINAFTDALRRATLKWRSCFDARLKGSGQSFGRARALIRLAAHPDGIMQRDLAADLSIEHPTLVRVLDSLERQKLIARWPVEGDKRVNRIMLTPAAEPLVLQVSGLFDSLRETMLWSVPAEDLAVATRVLEAIIENLDRAAKEPETAPPPRTPEPTALDKMP
ncbi:MarR family transcriptional regulator [Humitalea rosea]|uniref:MarR family transcriptional regulator n=1 Tax=Humitalea rosea TaxID=990373 RepID=A0A2W7IHN5_9PROT|nr:MarR family transcriptional regulator [Humitalea rosea]PZW36936.1 MarR family transcriptional regulator [Humitalea rosea]